MARDGRCVRCGVVVEWLPPRCPESVWVHRDPDECARILRERAEREEKALREAAR